ncbi:hypothetical protein [Maricaulis sp.]|nr:hypothetical protein [Maricaulis sp.]MBO6763651.1 hypothetical protein [Maricaulis sp.]
MSQSSPDKANPSSALGAAGNPGGDLTCSGVGVKLVGRLEAEAVAA